MQSREASSTSFWIFGITRPEIEPRSPGPLLNTKNKNSEKEMDILDEVVDEKIETRMKNYKKKIDWKTCGNEDRKIKGKGGKIKRMERKEKKLF